MLSRCCRCNLFSLLPTHVRTSYSYGPNMQSSTLRFSLFGSLVSVTDYVHNKPSTSSRLSPSLLPSRFRNLSTMLSQLRYQIFPVTISCVAEVTFRQDGISSPAKLVRPVLCYGKDGGGSGEAADIRDVNESSQDTDVWDRETGNQSAGKAEDTVVQWKGMRRSAPHVSGSRLTCSPKKKSAGKHSSNELRQKLKRYGIAGVLSYGLLNTVYYVTTFLFVWFYFAPAPGRMGFVRAVKRFFKLMAVVWAGSQVTKILRAGGALALAPFVDRGLSWFTSKFKFESEAKAFAAIVGACFGLALLLFLGLTVLWS